MEQNFEEYLKEIGIEGELLTKVEAVIKFYESIYPKFIPETLFITEYVNPDNSRIYENLWLINENFVAEAKNFNRENNFDFMNLEHRKVKYWVIKSKDFTPDEKSNSNSRLSIKVTFNDDMAIEFKASSNNCDHLFNIFKKYYKDKMME